MAGDRDPRDVADLLAFVRDRDVACPSCGYDLRGLTRPVCPECRQGLTLSVGVHRPRFGWFVFTIAPGIFSGIAAGLFLGPLYLAWVTRAGGPPWYILATEVFGGLSGLAAVGLYRGRHAFIVLPPAKQGTWAAVAWLVHVSAFFCLVALLLGWL